MNRMLIFTTACGLIATAAFAQTPSPRAPQSSPAATGETQRAPSAQDFVDKVAISDMFEIQSSQLALSKQPDTDLSPLSAIARSGNTGACASPPVWLHRTLPAQLSP